jgi:hypothetical protein
MPGPGDPLNVIQRGELNLRLARGLEVRQRAGAGLLLSDQVVPVVTLEDLTRQSLAIEPGERRAYMSTGVIAASPANFGAGAVFNPVASGALLVIRGFNASASVTQQLVWGISDSINLPGGVLTPWWSDPRTTGIPLALARQGTPAGNIVLTELMRTLFGTTTSQQPLYMPPDFAIVLVEGQSFVGQSAVANTAISFSFIWDEIPLR